MVTFGGWKEDFMLVVNKTTPTGSGQSELGTERLLFVLPRGKVSLIIDNQRNLLDRVCVKETSLLEIILWLEFECLPISGS